jgi:hypothetical protein
MSLETLEVPIGCPKCGAQIHKTRSWLAANDELTCGCGTVMYLETGDVVRLIDELEAALSRIQRPPPGGSDSGV